MMKCVVSYFQMANKLEIYVKMASTLRSDYGSLYLITSNCCGIVMMPKRKLSLPRAAAFLEGSRALKGHVVTVTVMPQFGLVLIS